MYTMSQFYADHPQRVMDLGSSRFVYRYHKNAGAKATLVLLTGGMGFSDLFYRHFHWLAREFSVLTFDYQLQYPTMQSFADAAAAVMTRLGITGWLVGQSLGGFVAQVIAKTHPEVVEGLILSNTGALAADMTPGARKSLEDMVHLEKQMKKLLKVIPFGIYKGITCRMLKKMGPADITPEEAETMAQLQEAVRRLMTREFEAHMIDFAADAETHEGMVPADFARWKGKVLLILSKDDKTFDQEVTEALVRLMPQPKILTALDGGHLSVLLRSENYLDTVSTFVRDVVENGAFPPSQPEAAEADR